MRMTKAQTILNRQQWGILCNVRKHDTAIYKLKQKFEIIMKCEFFSPGKICASCSGNTGGANVIQNDWVKKV